MHDYGVYLKDPKSETPEQTVEYYALNNTLYRKIDDNEESILLNNINSLNITYRSNGTYDLSLTVVESTGGDRKTIHVLSTTVQVRGKI